MQGDSLGVINIVQRLTKHFMRELMQEGVRCHTVSALKSFNSLLIKVWG